jgi:hypothetical protein
LGIDAVFRRLKGTVSSWMLAEGYYRWLFGSFIVLWLWFFGD